MVGGDGLGIDQGLIVKLALEDGMWILYLKGCRTKASNFTLYFSSQEVHIHVMYQE